MLEALNPLSPFVSTSTPYLLISVSTREDSAHTLEYLQSFHNNLFSKNIYHYLLFELFTNACACISYYFSPRSSVKWQKFAWTAIVIIIVNELYWHEPPQDKSFDEIHRWKVGNTAKKLVRIVRENEIGAAKKVAEQHLKTYLLTDSVQENFFKTAIPAFVHAFSHATLITNQQLEDIFKKSEASAKRKKEIRRWFNNQKTPTKTSEELCSVIENAVKQPFKYTKNTESKLLRADSFDQGEKMRIQYFSRYILSVFSIRTALQASVNYTRDPLSSFYAALFVTLTWREHYKQPQHLPTNSPPSKTPLEAKTVHLDRN
ncbi:MAG: hypothetical protein AAGI90_00570 [Chlamydiota bacterium]